MKDKEGRGRQERGGGPGNRLSPQRCSEQDRRGLTGSLGAQTTSQETASGAVTGSVTAGAWPDARDLGHGPPHCGL